jgi:phosphatidylglycerol:prolipoprotein diacylglycerol transferase
MDKRLLYVMLLGFAGGILGAKLVQWALLGFPGGAAAFVDPAGGGRTIIAGIVCGWIAVEIAKRRLGIRRSTGDYFALALPAGEAVGRIGCFLAPCCVGAETTARLAVFQLGAWRHPAQLYAIAIALAILGILLALRGRLPREGDLFRAYLLLYGLGRFSLEFLRQRDELYFGLSLAQWFGIELFIAGGIALIVSFWLARRTLAPETV